MAKIKFLVFITLPAVLFLSCAGDCKQVEIEKAEWVTRYEDYQVDTLVNYTVNDRVKLEEWSDTQNRDKHTHNVTIKNNNSHYSNRFAVQFQCYQYYDRERSWTIVTDYVDIHPNSGYTFVYEWSGARGVYDSDFDVSISILQEPKRISLKRQIDELHLSTIKVNTCEQSVEALKKQYQSVVDLYKKNVGRELQTHIVIRGENLSLIAKKYNCSVNDLRVWNNLSSDNIKAGQKLDYVGIDSSQWKIISENNHIY